MKRMPFTPFGRWRFPGFWGRARFGRSRQAKLFLETLEQANVKLEHGQTPDRLFPVLDLTRIRKSVDAADVVHLNRSPDWADDPKTRMDVNDSDNISFYLEGSLDGENWLFHHGMGRYTIFDRKGRYVVALPQIAYEYFFLIEWRWKTPDTLIGWPKPFGSRSRSFSNQALLFFL